MSTTPNDLFIQATKARLRFSSPQGDLSVEDLWDLPLTSRERPGRASLESVGNQLLVEQRKLPDESILKASRPNPAKVRIDLAVEVVRYIVGVREEEASAKTVEAAKAKRREELQEIIRARKATETPLGDLEKELAELG